VQKKLPQPWQVDPATGLPPRISLAELQQIWCHPPETTDVQLSLIANTLFERDDHRRQEESPFGEPFRS
jgi:hypothetical protein